MRPPGLTLTTVTGTFAICQLPPDAPPPAWATSGAWYSITRTADEVSIVCEQARVPEGVQMEGGWRALQVAGPLDFALTGVLAALANPLAEAGISLFAVSTYDTDYVLVKADRWEAARSALRAAGHTISA